MTVAIIEAAARFLTRVAAVFLLGMVAITVADVTLRSGFDAPIFGTYEIVELLLAVVAFLAIPEAFLRGEHITIELIDQVIPARATEWLRAFGTFAAMIFVALLAYHMIDPAMDAVRFHDVTTDLQIPQVWKAIPILAGIAFSIVAVAVVFVRELREALKGRS